MAKSTTERPTKVKKTTKATAADPPAKPSKTLRSSIVVEAEATTRTKSAEEPTKPSKKRKAAVEDTGNVAANTLSKTKKPKREAETKGEKPKNTEKVTAKQDVKRSKGRKNSDKTKTDKVEAQPEATAEEVEAEVEVEGVQEEEEVEFFVFATDDEDSSDEEDLDAEPEGVSVSKLPTVAKDDAVVKQKLEKAKRKAVRRIFSVRLDLVLSRCRPATEALYTLAGYPMVSTKTKCRLISHSSVTSLVYDSLGARKCVPRLWFIASTDPSLSDRTFKTLRVHRI